jgi:micrococcal nuclease
MTRFKHNAPFTRSTVVWLAICLLLFLLPVAATPGSIQAYQAKVISIADGDTITVLQGTIQIKIRLYGIDCPESHQAFGNKAKQFTSSLVFGQRVRVKPVTKDRYGRSVAWVYSDSKCLNEELLKVGLAWHFKKYSTDKNLSDLEIEARQKRVGLWSDPKPVAPWEYRRLKRAGG